MARVSSAFQTAEKNGQSNITAGFVPKLGGDEFQ
jgi:hypothetical protein